MGVTNAGGEVLVWPSLPADRARPAARHALTVRGAGRFWRGRHRAGGRRRFAQPLALLALLVAFAPA